MDIGPHTTTTAIRAPDLEGMILEQIKDRPACGNVRGVSVTADGPETYWRIFAILFDGQPMPPDCAREINAVAHQLMRQYHLHME
jgi:hypothetical protein